MALLIALSKNPDPVLVVASGVPGSGVPGVVPGVVPAGGVPGVVPGVVASGVPVAGVVPGGVTGAAPAGNREFTKALALLIALSKNPDPVLVVASGVPGSGVPGVVPGVVPAGGVPGVVPGVVASGVPVAGVVPGGVTGAAPAGNREFTKALALLIALSKNPDPVLVVASGVPGCAPC